MDCYIQDMYLNKSCVYLGSFDGDFELQEEDEYEEYLEEEDDEEVECFFDANGAYCLPKNKTNEDQINQLSKISQLLKSANEDIKNELDNYSEDNELDNINQELFKHQIEI